MPDHELTPDAVDYPPNLFKATARMFLGGLRLRVDDDAVDMLAVTISREATKAATLAHAAATADRERMVAALERVAATDISEFERRPHAEEYPVYVTLGDVLAARAALAATGAGKGE